MTIETQQGKKSWIGDGSTTSYPYSYPFLNASDIEVYLDGNKQTSGFSVQNKTDYSTGANIIFDVAPAEGVLIVIRRNIPMTQEISYPENGEFPAKSHEKSLDKLTMLVIDNNKETLKVGPATPEDFDATFPVPEANKALKITADGKGFTMSDYDPDIALALTEDFKNQAQQAAIYALSSQTAAANSETVATTQANIATTQANIATTQAELAKVQADKATEAVQNVPLPLLAYIWSDHLINGIQWLRANTFSWQSGEAYSNAYNKLVEEYDNESSTTETSGVITYKLTPNGFKIADATQEQSILDLYNSTGSAKIYILDKENTRFKLPRWKHKTIKDSETIPVKGNGMTLGLTDGSANVGFTVYNAQANSYLFNANNYGKPIGSSSTATASFTDTKSIGITSDSSKSGIVAKINNIETDDMYLYFYVGEYTQSVIEQTAGLNSELFNVKLDRSDVKAYITETYQNGTSGYRIWSDGYCHQWGYAQGSGTTVTLLKPMSNAYYHINLGGGNSTNWSNNAHSFTYYNITTTTFQIKLEEGSALASGMNCNWDVFGYLASGQY